MYLCACLCRIIHSTAELRQLALTCPYRAILVLRRNPWLIRRFNWLVALILHIINWHSTAFHVLTHDVFPIRTIWYHVCAMGNFPKTCPCSRWSVATSYLTFVHWTGSQSYQRMVVYRREEALCKLPDIIGRHSVVDPPCWQHLVCVFPSIAWTVNTRFSGGRCWHKNGLFLIYVGTFSVSDVVFLTGHSPKLTRFMRDCLHWWSYETSRKGHNMCETLRPQSNVILRICSGTSLLTSVSRHAREPVSSALIAKFTCLQIGLL